MSLVKSILTFYMACLRCSYIKAVLLRQKVDRGYPHPLTTERHALQNHLGRPGWAEVKVSVKRNHEFFVLQEIRTWFAQPQNLIQTLQIESGWIDRRDSLLPTLNIIQFIWYPWAKFYLSFSCYIFWPVCCMSKWMVLMKSAGSNWLLCKFSLLLDEY